MDSYMIILGIMALIAAIFIISIFVHFINIEEQRFLTNCTNPKFCNIIDDIG